jgi:hypothetical protein
MTFAVFPCAVFCQIIQSFGDALKTVYSLLPQPFHDAGRSRRRCTPVSKRNLARSLVISESCLRSIGGGGHTTGHRAWRIVISGIAVASLWRIAISPARHRDVTMLHTLTYLTSRLSVSNWMLLILKPPRLR